MKPPKQPRRPTRKQVKRHNEAYYASAAAGKPKKRGRVKQRWVNEKGETNAESN
jgi:hypothetical protein